MTDAGDGREPSKKEESVVLAAAMLATVVVTLDVSVVNIAIPQFERTFGVGIDAAQWVLNIYTLVFASLLLNAGALVDRWGTRRTFIAGFAVFVTASLACGVAPGWPFLLTARGCQGVGAALLVPSALAMIQQGVPEPTARARAIGWWAASGSAALAAGPVVGGALVALAGWRSIFLINLPIGIAGIWLAGRYLPVQRGKGGMRPDIAGQLLAMAMLACLVLAVSEGGRGQLTDAIGLAIAAVVLASVLTLVERRVRAPMLPPRLLAGGSFVTAVTSGAIISFVFYGLIFLLSVYFQLGQHRDALGAGLALAPMTVVLVGVNAGAGWFSAHLGRHRTITAGMALVGAGCVALAFVAGSPALAPLLPALLLIGTGTAMAVPAITASALAGVPPAVGGIASGVLNAARQVGGALGVAVFGAMLGSYNDVVVTLRMASLVAGALALLAIGLAYDAGRRTERF